MKPVCQNPECQKEITQEQSKYHKTARKYCSLECCKIANNNRVAKDRKNGKYKIKIKKTNKKLYKMQNDYINDNGFLGSLQNDFDVINRIEQKKQQQSTKDTAIIYSKPKTAILKTQKDFDFGYNFKYVYNKNTIKNNVTTNSKTHIKELENRQLIFDFNIDFYKKKISILLNKSTRYAH